MIDDDDFTEDDFARELARVRPVTRNLIEALVLDTWPRNAAVIDFGLDSQRHYEALCYPVRRGEISPKALDEAIGDGAKLTTLVKGAKSNPHKDVQFHTSYDRTPAPDGALSEEAKLARTMTRLRGPQGGGRSR